MNTIEDKLRRLAQTKSDIRNALLKTGIAVPADAKFSDYITKILEAPCYKFPDLPGDVTRWSFKGLTNEQMSKNPRLEDADHKGRFLTFKNFAWDGMSGCDGYTESFLGDKINWESEIYNSRKMSVFGGDRSKVSIIHNQYHFQTYVKISGIDANEGKVRGVYFYNMESSFTEGTICRTDGIYKIDITELNKRGVVGIWAYPAKKNEEDYDYPVTIEILPLYPGFIISDGVDDCAVTEKNLDFEDTYTVYTAFIPFQEDPTRNMVLCGKNNAKDFYMNYSSLNSINFYSSSKAATVRLSNGFNLIICKRTTDKMIIKNLLTNVSVEIDANAVSENPGLYYLWRSLNSAVYAKAAIAGQVICNGHFTSDEEDVKVLNWYKKEYPWLFFDQAWTVVGKTNEDEDRATIANITGNGNNLVLSNFGFAENSGYGEYAYNWNVWGTDNGVATNVSKQYNKFVAVMQVNQSISTCSLYSPEVSIGTKFQFKLKITGLTTNWTVRVMEGYTGDSNIIYEFDKDGTYQIDHTMTGSGNQLRLYIRMYCAVPNTEGTTVTVEQIPDHEGYLVTDGVDDIIKSSRFTIGKHFTVVGDWKLLNNEIVNAGIIKSSSLFVYNTISGLRVFINRAGNSYFVNTKTLRAIVSDGRMYDDNWEEYLDTNKQLFDNSNDAIFIGSSEDNSLFTRLIFKNLAIYPRFISKEDCIKAYIYLQTLKAK